MEVYPLSITQPNWEIFIKVSQDVLGYSPTRGLDADGLNPKSPCAFVASLDFNNKPKLNLRTSAYKNNLLAHMHVSFIIIAHEDIIEDFAMYTNLKIIIKRNHKKHIIVLTGSMQDWYDAIIKCCAHIVHSEVRGSMNIIHQHLEKGGFHELWSRYTKVYMPDETYTLQCPR